MISDIVSKEWDFIVVGTGIGGGTIGRRLAEAGCSVLFLERGASGFATERQGLSNKIEDEFARRMRGLWPTPIHEETNSRPPHTFFAPLGAGLGGTSVFYASSLERPERHDLEHTEKRPHPTGGWPVSYDAFSPYFAKAEQWYHVCGNEDPLSRDTTAPLSAPPMLSEGDTRTMDDFRRNGLHPYRAHIGIRYLPGCTECIGWKCPRDCKMDGRSAGVKPALATGNAHILNDCQVTRLVGTKTRIESVEARYRGETISLRARTFILAAGALSSPRLLLASASENWPEGCANESGLVGRNLMMHLNEMLAVWPSKKASFDGPAKTISLRDFYYRDGQRFGLLQSMGLSAEYGSVFHFLSQGFERSALRNLRPLREFLRIPALASVWAFGGARIFSATIEDLPETGNQLVYDTSKPEDIRVRYNIAPELHQRRKTFRKMIRKEMRGQRKFFLNFDAQLNYGHVCGTLKFGSDPANSVLDANCKAHGLENLYATDTSFMPTSTGVNPSLTNAANAMRVADVILKTTV